MELYRPGAVIRLPAFTSTSTAAAFHGNVRYILRVDAGRAIAPISLHPGEAEILVKAGARFRVVKVDQSGGGVTIMLKEIRKRKALGVVAQTAGAYVPSAADLEAVRVCDEYLAQRRAEPPREIDDHLSRKMQSGGWGEPAGLAPDEE